MERRAAPVVPSRTESAVYLALGALLLAFVGFLVLLGPIGWMLAAFLLAAGYVLAKWSGLLDGGESPVTAKVSCPECGARNEANRETCHHCGESLPAT